MSVQDVQVSFFAITSASVLQKGMLGQLGSDNAIDVEQDNDHVSRDLPPQHVECRTARKFCTNRASNQSPTGPYIVIS